MRPEANLQHRDGRGSPVCSARAGRTPLLSPVGGWRGNQIRHHQPQQLTVRENGAGPRFTLAHELAHLCVGHAGEGLSGFENISSGGTEVEASCDRAAAEFPVAGAGIEDHPGRRDG